MPAGSRNSLKQWRHSTQVVLLVPQASPAVVHLISIRMPCKYIAASLPRLITCARPQQWGQICATPPHNCPLLTPVGILQNRTHVRFQVIAGLQHLAVVVHGARDTPFARCTRFALLLEGSGYNRPYF